MHRLYENEDLAVFWDSEKCQHARKCVTGSPQVFDFMRKPWIDLGGASNERIWDTVKQCPSGALDILYRHDVTVELDPENRRSIALFDGRIIGECDYQETSDVFQIVHTEVDPDFSGKGIAKRLVYKVVEEAERQKKIVQPFCSYAAKVLA